MMPKDWIVFAEKVEECDGFGHGTAVYVLCF